MPPAAPLPHPVLVCADDYGLSPGVGSAIRALIRTGRLSAASCITGTPYWPEEAERLRPLADRADVGLHLTLTDQAPLGPMPGLAPTGRLPPVAALIRLALARRIDPTEIGDELARQIRAFTDAFGRPPDFIDGHQHVHQLPAVRDAVARAAAAIPGCYVRLCRDPVAAILRRGVAAPKALLISALGRGLERGLEAAAVPANGSFRGVYDLTGRVPFGDLMARFLDRPAPRMLVMVHPGYPDEALRRADPLTDQRAVEHAWLAGDAFPALLEARNLRIARFSGL